jgi:Flp pilus assembly protein TadD
MSPPSIKECKRALDAGAADEALRLGIELLHRNKNNIDALTVCYKAYRLKNDLSNAVKVVEVILNIDPTTDWAAAELGKLYYLKGSIDRAEAVLRKAVELHPDNAAAHSHIGAVFSELNRLAAGEWHFRRALEIDGPDCETLTNLALNLTRQEKADEADYLYRQAHEMEPGNITTIAYWAKLYEVRGEFDQARALLDKAMATRPGSVDLLLATLAARTGDNEGALSTINQGKKLNGDALLERGIIRDRIGDYDGAWDDFVAAKRLLAEEAGGLRYDAAAVETFFNELRDAFNEEAMRELPRASARTDAAQPIFIVGAPRSGTTLVERILASHSAIKAGGELPFIQDLRVFSEKLLPEAGFPKNISAARVADQRHVTTLFRDFYFAHRDERLLPSSDTLFVTDKMPFNEMYLPLIRMAFPDCPVLHVARHRLDVALSMLSNKLNHGFHCAYRIEDILHHLDAVSALHASYRQHFDTREFELSYEALTEDPETVVHELLDYVGLPFEERCLRFYEERRFVATPSYRQVDAKISGRAVGRHRNYQRQFNEVLPPE